MIFGNNPIYIWNMNEAGGSPTQSCVINLTDKVFIYTQIHLSQLALGDE